MYLFNEAISFLGLTEIHLKGRRFTWTNKQQSPLLERLDWFFTSPSWTLSYPNTYAYPLSMETSDHTPCAISVSTKIPKGSIFRFKNHWLEHPLFLFVVQQHWVASSHITDAAKVLTAKLKNLRHALKIWKSSLSNLKSTIANVKVVLNFLQVIEEYRDLTVPEWNFRVILESKLQNLLKQQKIYWKQRGQIKWVTLGDAGTKFFHANATMKYRRNLITSLENNSGVTVFDHQQKAHLIWQSFKERLGISEFSGI